MMHVNFVICLCCYWVADKYLATQKKPSYNFPKLGIRQYLKCFGTYLNVVLCNGHKINIYIYTNYLYYTYHTHKKVFRRLEYKKQTKNQV